MGEIMGTNYYQTIDGIERHIGKSSGGWCFSLHAYPEEGILNLGDYDFSLGIIKDEYGDYVSPDKMMEIITKRSCGDRKPVFAFGGYKSEHHFLEKNYAQYYAPHTGNYLLRRILSGHCIGHGKGTWDILVGEFS